MTAPKLRFKEFSYDWEEKFLGDIATFTKGKGISKSDIVSYGKNPCIRYGELYTVYGVVIDKIHSFTDLDIKNYTLSKVNQVIIPASGETKIDIATASCVLVDNVILGGDLNILTTNENGVFLANYLNFSKKIEIAQLAQGISVIHLYAKQLAGLNVKLPCIEEQTKIANFLTTVDEKISQLNEQHQLMIQYKKGVMQKIFSQEIRFKDDDGEEFGEWESLPANNIFENFSCRDHNCSLTVLASTQNQGIVPRDEINIDIKSSNESLQNYKIVNKGNFVISLRSFQGGIEYSEYDGICSPAYTVLKTIKPISEYFYKNYLKTTNFIKRLNTSVIGIRDGKQISYQVFSRLKLHYPTIEEQTKIADFLTAIDQRIENLAQQLELAKIWKKGLLQQMFV